MCLTTRDATIRVATTDIEVYKTLDMETVPNENRSLLDKLLGRNKSITRCYSPAYDFTYEMGKPSAKVILEPEDCGDDLYEVNPGYHVDTELEPRHNAIFIIPKGTKYILGWYNDEEERENIVAETITLKAVLDRE